MKFGCFLIGVLMSVAAATAHTSRPSNVLKVMSFNARNSGAGDFLNAWPLRKNLFFDRIAHDDPDLIGFQEVLADQHDDIAQRMSAYAFVGVARDDGHRKGEWALLGYRRERFDLLGGGNFWLSEHPEQPGSISWDAACIRICTWAKLRDRRSGHAFLFANTHWDHIGVVARQQSARLCKERLPRLSGGDPVILAGDFNSFEDDAWMKSLESPTAAGEIKLLDSYREVHPVRRRDEASFNNFSGVTEGSRIDFIFHTPGLTAVGAGIDRVKASGGRFPSDHYAVTATLRSG